MWKSTKDELPPYNLTVVGYWASTKKGGECYWTGEGWREARVDVFPTTPPNAWIERGLYSEWCASNPGKQWPELLS